MPASEIIALVLILGGVLILTSVMWLTLRAADVLVARHRANLALPFGLVPLVVALGVTGPRSGIGVAVLIVLLQTVSGATESHMVGRVEWLRGRKRTEGTEGTEGTEFTNGGTGATEATRRD